VPKIGGLVALFRLLSVAIPVTTVNWHVLIAVLAAATMTLGNLAAFFQTSVRRLLAYSTISQAGYVLMAVVDRSATALRSLLFYLAAYSCLTSTGQVAGYQGDAAAPGCQVGDGQVRLAGGGVVVHRDADEAFPAGGIDEVDQ
jgi:hypothetical protein